MTPTEITLLAIISIMESRNDPNAINGDAVGMYQITTICLRDCQRLWPDSHYTDADRWDVKRAGQMCLDYTGYWARNSGVKYRYNEKCELATRMAIWRKGPQGFKKKTGITYANNGLKHYKAMQWLKEARTPCE